MRTLMTLVAMLTTVFVLHSFATSPDKAYADASAAPGAPSASATAQAVADTSGAPAPSPSLQPIQPASGPTHSWIVNQIISLSGWGLVMSALQKLFGKMSAPTKQAIEDVAKAAGTAAVQAAAGAVAVAAQPELTKVQTAATVVLGAVNALSANLPNQPGQNGPVSN